MQLVKDFFDSKFIPGQVINKQFENLSQKRNYAFDTIRGKVDQVLWIDCDDELVLSPGFDINKLKKQLSGTDIGLINVKHGNTQYAREHMLNFSKKFYWEGVAHETIICDQTPDPDKLLIEDVTILCHGDGNATSSQTQREKFMGHAKLLEKEVALKNKSRDVFYLAQSYRDAGEREKAIEWYSKRLLMVGFYEELYISQLNIAHLKWQLQEPIEVIADEFMKCGELDDLRAEHLLYLKQMYERNNRPASARKIEKLRSEYYNKHPYPQRVLFILPEAYLAFSKDN